jgi:PadR family transcriptional regulator, regulatory protein PadR
MKKCCDMKGFLSFLVLRLIRNRSMSGEEIRQELEKRKGHKPSPGTIYPVLKTLSENKWIEAVDSKTKEKKYQITAKGKKEVEEATKKFVSLFCDMGCEFN